MTEQELLDATIELAALLGWRSFHVRPARTAHGWATAVQGNGRGFPDLVLLWLDAFAKSGADVFVWRPDDWTSGQIEAELRRRAA